MKILDIQEDGSRGFVGAADIAPAPNRGPSITRRPIRNGDVDWHNSIEQQRAQNPDAQRHADLQARQGQSLKNSRALLAKKRSFLGRLKQFFADQQRGQFRISESFDMNDVISKMSSLEGENAADSTVSYGVEDDNGNLMKVTVRAEQAEEFEDRLAQELADAARRQDVTGGKTSISMAELLYTLNDEFDIVDVTFPQIPTDAVYNADKVQYGVADTAEENIASPGEDTLGTDGFPEDAVGAEDMGGDPMAAGGDMGAEGGDPMAAGAEGEMGAEGGAEGDEFFGDDESVEDFPAEAPAGPEDNMITSILKMLTADADSRKAEADARAEEARAKQAEYSAMAAKNSVAQQEEVARMEAEIEKSKKQEKDAKRIADLARYRVGKASGYTEAHMPTFAKFLDIVLEFDEFDTLAGLNKQLQAIRAKFAPAPGDDADTQTYKRQALGSAMQELNAKKKRLAAAERFKATQERRAKLAGQQPQPGRPSLNPQQQALQAQQQAQQMGQQAQPGQQ